MHPAVVVQVVDAVGGLDDYIGYVVHEMIVIAQKQFLEVRALDEFQHHEWQSIGFAVIDVADDVGMGRQLAHHAEAGLEKLGRVGLLEHAPPQPAHGDDVLVFVGCEPNFRDSTLIYAVV